VEPPHGSATRIGFPDEPFAGPLIVAKQIEVDAPANDCVGNAEYEY